MNYDFIALGRLACSADGLDDFGYPIWKSRLSENLGIKKRTIDAFVSGEVEPKQSIMDEVVELAAVNINHLAKLGLFIMPIPGAVGDVYISNEVAEMLLKELENPIFTHWNKAKKIIENNC